MTIELNDANFEEKVIKSDKPVLVDFWAEWCGPCRMIGPIVHELSDEYNGRAVFGKVDIDSNFGVATKYGIKNIPTILFFKNGQIVDKQIGTVPKKTLAEKIQKLL